MSHFLKDGNTFRIAPKAAIDLHDTLPRGCYVVKVNQMGLYLEQMEDFELPSKRYGENEAQAQRILTTFKSRKSTTGVMLVGEKGSGKSLLAKTLCVYAGSDDIPTIMVNEAFSGDDFNQFIQLIEQPAVIFFDEFEKVYDEDAQQRILTLLDGTCSSQKLFIFTSNNKWKVDQHMRNRPGRIYYMLEFEGLSEQFIREYCADTLNNQEFTDKIVVISSMFNAFNFDMLKAIVEEVNRYNEDPSAAVKWLNIKPEYSGEQKYNVVLTQDGVVLDPKDYNSVISARPLIAGFRLNVEIGKDEDDEEVYDTIYLAPSDLVKIDQATNEMIFRKDRYVASLKREEPKYGNNSWNHLDLDY